MGRLGGATDGEHYYQDAISSKDGVHWRAETVHGPWFNKRKNHSACSYDGGIVLAGGSMLDSTQPGGGRLLNDVWSSADGSAWICLSEHALWSPRCIHELLAYRGKLRLVGGEFGGGHYATDQWSTRDGIDWTQETDRFAWPPRHAGGTLVFHDKLWVFGGASSSTGQSSRNDIWTFEATSVT